MAVIFNRHSRRWWHPQFGLRGMFLILTAFGIWLGVYVHRARQQQAAVQAIQAVEAAVLYDYQKNAVGYDSRIPSSLPRWLRTSLGDDFFYDVECADFFVLRWSSANDVDLSDASWAAIMPRLPALTKLRCLAVKSAKEMSDRSARYIGDLPHLETLTMEDAHHVTDETVSLFGRLKLTSLQLTNSRITDESLRTIGRLPLKRLILNGSCLTDAGLAHLAGQVELQTLCLGGDALRVTDEGMSSLAELLNLKELDLSGADLTPKGMEHLKRFTKLNYLELSNNRRISDQGLACLAQLVNLEYLNLQNTSVTSRGLGHLKRMKKLRWLNLSDNREISDQGIEHLGQLAGLEELKLHHTAISSRAVEYLTKLPKLSRLDLSENDGITEAVIPYLAGLRAAEDVDLHYTRLSSSGALTAASVAPLARVTRLHWLHLAGTGVNTNFIKAALPTCDVIGSDADEPLAPDLTTGIDYRLLMHAIGMRESEISMRKQDAWMREHGIAMSDSRGKRASEMESAGHPLAAPELLRTVVDRMIALAQIETLDAKLMGTRSLLEGFASRLRQHPYHKRSAKQDLTAFLDVAASNAAVMRLYIAATSLVFADGLSEHLDHLDRERQRWALTDVEMEQHVAASKYLSFCLNDAAEQLHLGGDSVSDAHAATVRSVWQDTRPAIPALRR